MKHSHIPHIQIDSFPLVDSHFSGVGHYAWGIISAIDSIAGEGKLTYSLIAPRRISHKLHKYNLKHYKRIIPNPIPMLVIRALMEFRIPFPYDLLLGNGCYYFPSFLAWSTWFSKSAVVIHDVTYLAVPECVSKGNRYYLKKVMPFSIKNASRIITISEFSKLELAKYYQLTPHKITVARPSVDRRHFYRRSKEEIRRVKAKYDIFSEKYILSVGNIEPRKNYLRLVDAYTDLPKMITDSYSLVIVGAGGWNNDDIIEKIQKAKEEGYRIINPKQFVEDSDMPALYSGASCYIFVPIYEGFGMSPLEAYACGTPVIASNIPAVQEAAGEPAVYIDPYNVEDITGKILSLLEKVESNSLQFYEAIEKHLASFSWRFSAETTLAAITGLPAENFKSEN